MEDMYKQIAYLRGYAEGLSIGEKSEEGKILVKILDTLDAMADEMERIAAAQDEMDVRVEDLEDSIDLMEEDLYSDEEESDFQKYLSDMDGEEEEDDDLFGMDFDGKEDDSDYFEIECPNCGEDVLIDFDMIDDDNGIVCPNCHEEIQLEFDCDCDDCKDEEEDENK